MSRYCCDFMEHAVLERDIEYLSNIRYYGIFIPYSDTGTLRTIKYCPWCGIKLPNNLEKAWGSILRLEYEIEDPGWKKDEELPEEFRTDEWWRKRDL